MLADYSVARDPSKRRVKPTPTVELFPLTLESESEDSDFKLEDDEIDGDDSDSASVSSSSSDTSDTEKEETEENPEQIKEKNGLPTVPGLKKLKNIFFTQIEIVINFCFRSVQASY